LRLDSFTKLLSALRQQAEFGQGYGRNELSPRSSPTVALIRNRPSSGQRHVPIAEFNCETSAGLAPAESLRSDTCRLYGRCPPVDLVLEKTGEILRAAPLRSDNLDTETLESLTNSPIIQSRDGGCMELLHD
jgi:hypothetical protein